jgi:hypothetical protein
MRSHREELGQSRQRNNNTYAASGGGGGTGGGNGSGKNNKNSSSVLEGFRGPQVHLDVHRGAGEGTSAGRLQAQQERLDDWSSQPQRAFTDQGGDYGNYGSGGNGGGSSGGVNGAGSGGEDPTSAHALAAMEHSLARVTAAGDGRANGGGDGEQERTTAALRAAASFVSEISSETHKMCSREEQ